MSEASLREYEIFVHASSRRIADRALEHLRFNLHWSRSFWDLKDVTEHDEIFGEGFTHVLFGRAVWYERKKDMMNFSTYYPKALFRVKRSDGLIENYMNGVRVEVARIK